MDVPHNNDDITLRDPFIQEQNQAFVEQMDQHRLELAEGWSQIVS